MAVADSKPDIIIYGDASYPPYTWVEDGAFKGIYVDIYTRAFEYMDDYNIRLEPVPWERGLSLLEHGKAFALFPPYYYANHRSFISPYSTPIMTEKTVLVCRNEIFSEDRHEWPNDYFGLTIGVNSGYLVGGEKFLDAVEQGKIFISESLQAKQNLLMVARGRIDCYINDERAIKLEINRLSSQYRYHRFFEDITIGPVISRRTSYLGFTKVNEDKYPFKIDFINKFNATIEMMKKNGEIDEIINQYVID